MLLQRHDVADRRVHFRLVALRRQRRPSLMRSWTKAGRGIEPTTDAGKSSFAMI